MSNEQAEAARKNLLEQARTHMTAGEFACWLAILQGFYQTKQDLERNAVIVFNSLSNGIVSYSGYNVKIAIEDFRNFNPGKENIARFVVQAMHVGHWESKVSAKSLMFADDEEQKEWAVGLYIGVKERVLILLENEKRK